MDINLFFSRLTGKLKLGGLLLDAKRVQGGLMHTMYRLDTVTGAYAVKLLSPNVMKRPDAMGNFLTADSLEEKLKNNNIPVAPSLIFGGRKMQELDGQYFYVYEWYDGKTLKDKDITKPHCQEMGRVLSRIHNIDIKSKGCRCKPINIAWDYYIKLAEQQSSPVHGMLAANIELLYESQLRGNIAVQGLSSAAICHNDMDSKNVLWSGMDFRIIDLECLCYASPQLELLEAALCWSGYEECQIDFDLFGAFISAYFEAAKTPEIDWEAVYYGNYGRLEWLEYNVKRALMLECGTAEEQALGLIQVKEALSHVVYYSNVKSKILSCIAQVLAAE